MKNIFAIIYLLIALSNPDANAQRPQWAWARAIQDSAGTNLAYNKVTTDDSGNVYVSGSFKGYLDIQGQHLQGKGRSDGFLAKFSSTGTMQWIKTIGTVGKDNISSVKTDGAGNLYIAGCFSDTLNYAGITLVSKGNADIFVMKLTHDGNVIWANSAGGVENDYTSFGIGGLAVDNSGSVYLTGIIAELTMNAIPGTATFDTVILHSTASNAIFVAKYYSNGQLAWAKAGGGVNGAFSLEIGVDKNKNAYIVGGFSEPYADFDNIRLLSVGYFGNMFLTKYDSSGHALWAKTAGGPWPTDGLSLALNKAGYCYVVGHAESQNTDFGSGHNFTGDNTFIAKYAPNGAIQWVVPAGNNSHDIGNHILADSASNIYITGDYAYTGRFGADSFNCNGGPDVLVAKYDSSGSNIWAMHGGGNGADAGYGLALDKQNNLYVSGIYQGAAAAFGSHTLASSPAGGMFVARLSATTGIPQVPVSAVYVAAYPNPSAGSFALRWDNVNFQKATITTPPGATVSTIPILKGQRSIQVTKPELADGLYFIELQGEGGTAITKITIHH